MNPTKPIFDEQNQNEISKNVQYYKVFRYIGLSANQFWLNEFKITRFAAF